MKGACFMNKNVSTIDIPAAAGIGTGSGVVDSNRFYSMLLDARTASVTENMHDIAEKLLKGEKDNSKLALDQLWTLKKTLIDPNTDDTVECMIAYYQDKIDVLREREEAIKKASKETRALIEEKMRKDEELALVKSQIISCADDLKALHSKLETLKKREAELVFAEQRLRREISVNENHIVSGLHDIILHRPEQDEEAYEENDAAVPEYTIADDDNDFASAFTGVGGLGKPVPPDVIVGDEYDDSAEDAYATVAIPAPEAPRAYEPVVYPKSVVRMGGKIIGEYYHDGNIVAKEERHYIYNSRFLAECLCSGLNAQRIKFSQDIHAELIKVVEDAANRVRDNSRFHFEVSTNEILNDKNLRQLSVDLRRRAWDDAGQFVNRLNAKMEALGSNYGAMLQEQMERCSEGK